MADDFGLDLATLTAATFEPVRGQTFHVAGPDGDLDLTLHEVRALGAAMRAGGAFALTFVGPAGPHLPQAIYPLTHEQLGTLDLFLVPSGPAEGGNGYESVFG